MASARAPADAEVLRRPASASGGGDGAGGGARRASGEPGRGAASAGDTQQGAEVGRESGYNRRLETVASMRVGLNRDYSGKLHNVHC